MSDLSEFLLARIAEDEAAARGQLELRASRYPGEVDDDLERVRYLVDRGWWLHAEPDFVLADCEAKRRIVESFLPPDDGVEWALRCLALPYAGHPDYDPEWKP